MNKNSCLYCKDREMGCHAVCSKYTEYAKENARLREERNKQKQESLAASDVSYEGRRRMMRKGI